MDGCGASVAGIYIYKIYKDIKNTNRLARIPVHNRQTHGECVWCADGELATDGLDIVIERNG